MRRAVLEHIWLAWRSFALPGVLVVCALLAIANVNNQVDSVRNDYAQLQQTKANYRTNGMDFESDLRKPAHVVTRGNEQTVDNLARFDYDNFTDAVAALKPASSLTETLYFFCFVFFPALFFLSGLWLSTIQRRYRFEKVSLVRLGATRTVLSRQLAMLVTSAVVLVVVVGVEVVARAIGSTVIGASLPVTAHPPLGPAPLENVGAQLALLLLVTVFFGGAGITVGALFGVLALPAIAFLLWDLVIPFLGSGDPRNWIVILGLNAFGKRSNDGGYHLPAALPLAEPLALGLAVGCAIVLAALAYFCSRIRNPLAT